MSSTSSASVAATDAPSAVPTFSPAPRTSASLYLFTFLATLFLLLAISAAIVGRSIVLRRQYRIRLNEALAAGYPAGTYTKRIRDKPKLYDAHIAPGGDTWVDIMPVSVQRAGSPSSSQSSHQRRTAPSTTSVFVRDRLRELMGYRAPPVPPPSPPPARTSSDPARVQISVLVAMPSQHRVHSSPGGEAPGNIPDVVLGTTLLPYRPIPDALEPSH